MATLVLLGFSCAGKSKLGEAAQALWPDLEVLDSDRWVAQDYTDANGESHIVNMFVELGRSAIDEIERREAEFLDEQRPTDHPVLIAAGPGLVIRKRAWDQFMTRVKPCVLYLVQSPEQAAGGLTFRRTKQLGTDLVDEPHFGSWDEGTLTIRDGDRWVDDGADRIVGNVAKHMQGLVDLYETIAGPDDRIPVNHHRSPEEQRDVLRRIGELLGLSIPTATTWEE